MTKPTQFTLLKVRNALFIRDMFNYVWDNREALFAELREGEEGKMFKAFPDNIILKSIIRMNMEHLRDGASAFAMHHPASFAKMHSMVISTVAHEEAKLAEEVAKTDG